jgi:hypothetical protein
MCNLSALATNSCLKRKHWLQIKRQRHLDGALIFILAPDWCETKLVIH